MSLIAVVVLLGICVLMVVTMARAASKPRTTPKLPRDRRQDTQVVFWFRLF